jgi:hypothetical protein
MDDWFIQRVYIYIYSNPFIYLCEGKGKECLVTIKLNEYIY